MRFAGLPPLPFRGPEPTRPASRRKPEEDAGGAAPGPAGRLRRGQGHGEAGAVHRGSAGEAGQVPRLIRRGDGSVASPVKKKKRCFLLLEDLWECMEVYGGRVPLLFMEDLCGFMVSRRVFSSMWFGAVDGYIPPWFSV